MEDVLSPEQLEGMKKSLIERRESILEQRDEYIKEIRKEKESLKDLADIASYEDEVEKLRWIVEKGRKMESKINIALQRMKDGAFGTCRECESPITFKRLSIDPTSDLCIGCMSEYEGTGSIASAM